MRFDISLAGPSDYAALGQIMYDAVRLGDSPYSQAEREAWMPEPRSGEVWNTRLSEQYVLKADIADGKTIGFMTLRRDGYVDFAYINMAMRGKGLFRKLYSAIETETKSRGLAELTTHASLMAQPAFSAMGFDIIEKESVETSGEHLQRYHMRKAV